LVQASHRTFKMQALGTMGSTSKPKERKTSGKAFMGKLQPVVSRLPAVPPVNYEKGGSDFRCPLNTSAFGKQTTGGEQKKTAPTTKFGNGNRFPSSETMGIGPAGVGQMSAMKNQPLSNRRSAESTSFGTSSRDGAWKLYAIYTAKRF
jgi:hypothetical protein